MMLRACKCNGHSDVSLECSRFGLVVTMGIFLCFECHVSAATERCEVGWHIRVA